MTNNKLVLDAIGGDNKAFDTLINNHRGRLYGAAIGILKDEAAAEDVLQEVCLKIFLKLHTIQKVEYFGSWAYQIALNTSLNALRSKKMRNRINTELGARDDVYTPDLEGQMYTTIVSNILKEEIDRLPDRQRQATELHLYSQMNFKEVAEEMGCAYDTAKAHYRIAMLKLTNKLKLYPEISGERNLLKSNGDSNERIIN